MDYTNPFRVRSGRSVERSVHDYMRPVSSCDDMMAHLEDTPQANYMSETQHRLIEMQRWVKQVWPNVTFKQRYSDSLWVCFPDELYPRGWVGWGNHATSEADARYMVGSLAIEQYRFRHDDRRHVALTTVENRFVALVKQNLQPITSQLVAIKAAEELGDKYLKTKKAKYYAAAEAFTVLTGSNDLGSGYEGNIRPETLQFINNLAESIPKDKIAWRTMFDAVRDWETTKLYESKEVTLLWTDAQRIKVLPLGVLGANTNQITKVGDSMETTYPDYNALPDQYKAKVSMLHIAQEGAFVPNVGWREGEVYCVQD